MTDSPPDIAVIDYGMGNLRSVEKALAHLGFHPSVTGDPAVIAQAPGVILPGVGAFGDAMSEIRRRGLLDVILDRGREALSGGRVFLGVCVGMQLLVEEGEEDPGVEGLALIPGHCPRMRPGPGFKVPHMGWNGLEFLRPECPLLAGLDPGSHTYFVHSFHVLPEDPGCVAAQVDYGHPIASVLWSGNLFATQFHPEKSQRVGLKLLENFGRIAISAPTA